MPQGRLVGTRTQTSISLSWNASTDNVGVTGYRLYNSTTLHGTTAQTTYTFNGLACGTNYSLGVTARDAAGNESYRPGGRGRDQHNRVPDPDPDPDRHGHGYCDGNGNRHGHAHGDRNPAGGFGQRVPLTVGQ